MTTRFGNYWFGDDYSWTTTPTLDTEDYVAAPGNNDPDGVCKEDATTLSTAGAGQSAVRVARPPAASRLDEPVLHKTPQPGPSPGATYAPPKDITPPP